ncbi:MAG: PAS domain-containing protein [Spirochaetia bacterium]|jgi:predicted transcriptional regulator YheO|nr:PAS domain-containing protein [Spirochaetia bacterium]
MKNKSRPAKKSPRTASPKKQASFSPRDRQALDCLRPVVDGIAGLFGENCEALLHSFESPDRPVIHIANGHISGRAPGAPISGLGMKILQESFGGECRADVSGCYSSRMADGKTLRSIAVLIRGDSRRPIGMLCISLNLSAPLASFLDAFAEKPRQEIAENTGNFAATIEDLVETTLQGTISAINSRVGIPNSVKNKTIVHELVRKGIFGIRGAIDIVARELSVSRYTIYNYIRENKFLTKEELP